MGKASQTDNLTRRTLGLYALIVILSEAKNLGPASEILRFAQNDKAILFIGPRLHQSPISSPSVTSTNRRLKKACSFVLKHNFSACV
jgi:hypothetical protein